MQHRWRSTPTNRKVPSLPRSRRVSWSNGWRSVDRQTEWERQAGLSLNKDELQTQPILNFLGSDSSPSDQTINRLPQSPISPLVPQHGRSTGTLPISEASQVGLSERTPPFSFSLDILLIRLIRSPLFLPVCSCFFHSFWWFQPLYPIPRPSPGHPQAPDLAASKSLPMKPSFEKAAITQASPVTFLDFSARWTHRLPQRGDMWILWWFNWICGAKKSCIFCLAE